MARTAPRLRPALWLGGAWIAFLLASPPAVLADEFGALARLSVLTDGETDLVAPQSQQVVALPSAADQPVRRGEVVAELDTAELEKEIAELERSIANSQSSRLQFAGACMYARIAAPNEPHQGWLPPSDSCGLDAATSTAETLRRRAFDAIEESTVRAPRDGYVVHNHVAVGDQARKRKPLLTFVAAEKTVVETSIPAVEAGQFAVGTKVLVSGVGSNASFLGTVTAALAAGERMALSIQPLELPFLALDRPTQVAVTALP